MHELSIAQSILDTVVSQTEEHQASRVVSIRLRIGELTTIVEGALKFSFEAVSLDTCAHGARLDIEFIPWRVQCSECANEYQVTNGMPACPQCKHAGGKTISGRELQIVEMDVE